MRRVELDLAALKAELAAGGGAAGGGAELAPIGLETLAAGPGALDRLPELVERLAAGRDGPVVVLATATAILASTAGAPLREAIDATTPGKFSPYQWVVVGPATGSPHADAATVARARAAAAAAGCVITVGSGTLTDIGKVAAPPGGPLICVQTATSVNGYADPFSVLLRDGVKRTTASRWPDALVIDSGVLEAAPGDLNRAGFGDMAAMFTATADWYLAAAIGADGPPYQRRVADLVRPYGDRMLALARAAPGQDQLTELALLLTRSGIAMGVAGATAPASGMEHAISHLVEMAATARGEDGNPHGTCVGVASIVAAATWEYVRDKIADGALSRPVRLPDPDDVAARLEAAFAGLDPTGAMAAECLADYAVKLRSLTRQSDPLAGLRANWAAIDRELGQTLTGAATLAAALASAGLPVRFADLPDPVAAERARWATAHCASQRRRFGVADLAGLLGSWEDADIDAVLAAAAGAAAAADTAAGPR